MATAAQFRTGLAALVLLAATEIGSGTGTPSPAPTWAPVGWTKDNLKGAFKNGCKASVAGDTLLLTSTAGNGSVAVVGSWWGAGPVMFSAPFGLHMADTTGKAGLQVIFNATGPNDGQVEVDIFAKSNGSGIDVSAGVFGGGPPATMGFPGADCVFLKAEREAGGDVGLSASSDGDIFTKVFTLPAGSIPAPADGTIPTIVSVASHGATKGTVIEVGAPTKTFAFGSGVMKDALDAIEAARSFEAGARSDLRKGNAASAHVKLVGANGSLSQAISTLKGSAYGATVPGKAAVKNLEAAKKLDGAADAEGATDPGAARGKLDQTERLKADALGILRKL